MQLKELFQGLTVQLLRGNEETFVTGITADSRQVSSGMAFFCLTGLWFDGNDFAEECIQKGAVLIVTQEKERAEHILEKDLPGDAAVALVSDVRSCFAFACANYYGNPAKKLITIGVTGTKGKTTCTYLIRSILENAGRRVGLIGTNEVIIGREHLRTENTTPDAYLLQGYFKRMADEGLDTVVMEVSSLAVKQRRTDGFTFDYGIFTNLSPDHVSPGEHPDFQDYLECKRELFRRCRVGIVNGDDPCHDKVTEGHSCELETYGLGESCGLWADGIACTTVNGRLGVRFHVKGLMDFEVSMPLPGRFSVYNALAAISLCRHFHVRESDAQRALLAAKVRGRIECVADQGGFHVLIDYAHNPVALASLLDTLREYNPKRLICLFGCGGDRPAMRRRLMGRISGEKADLTIVTDDNPRSERPETIREEIAEGVRETKGAYVVIPGRREAIRHAISIAGAGDVIVLAGKGHETYQEIGKERIPMDERIMIGEILEETCHTQT